MKQLLKQQYGLYIGLIGIVCLGVSGVFWGIRMQFGTVSQVLAILGLIGLLVYTVLNFKGIQAQFAKRSVKYGANVTVMILFVLGIIVLIEAISLRHNFQWDVTRNQRFTLSEQTKNVLTGLQKDIKVIAFFAAMQDNPVDEENRVMLENLLKQYGNLTSRIQYEFVDPLKNPGRAKTYEITYNGTIVLETAEKQEKIREATEDALTNAIVNVTKEGQKVIYVVKGHGEHDLGDADKQGYNLAKKAIEEDHYAVKDLVFMQQPMVPADANVVIVAGPQKDLAAEELNALKTYIQGGGAMLLMIDPDQAQGMMAFLKDYGILLGDDMVLDPSIRLLGAGIEIPVIVEYQEHPITSKLNMYTCFPIARSVKADQNLPQGVTVQPLTNTSPESWAETSKEELRRGRVDFNPGSDVRGPLSVAAAATIEVSAEKNTQAETPAKKARLVVIGDSDFASNAYLGFYGNTDFFLNALNWLAEEEAMVAVRAKDPEISPLPLTANQIRAAFLIAIVLLPLAVVVTGITVFMKRRQMTR